MRGLKRLDPGIEPSAPGMRLTTSATSERSRATLYELAFSRLPPTVARQYLR
jgi:hypothetical protein